LSKDAGFAALYATFKGRPPVHFSQKKCLHFFRITTRRGIGPHSDGSDLCMLKGISSSRCNILWKNHKFWRSVESIDRNSAFPHIATCLDSGDVRTAIHLYSCFLLAQSSTGSLKSCRNSANHGSVGSNHARHPAKFTPGFNHADIL
jgi:hypothetical protein